MAAHTFLADSLDDAVVGGQVTLTGPEGHHASSVLRVRSGETVEVVDGRGRRVQGVVFDVRKDVVAITVAHVIDEDVPQPRVVVVQALAKGDRGERAVELMTEVGVDAIVPWEAERSVSRWREGKAERGPDKWRAVARAASKQSRRARVPEVLSASTTTGLESLMREADIVIVLDETAQTPIADCPVPLRGTIVLIVGPEGSISDGERTMLASWGAHFVHLGPAIMRTSTAGAVAAAIVMSTSGRWRDVASHARMPS